MFIDPRGNKSKDDSANFVNAAMGDWLYTKKALLFLQKKAPKAML